MDLIGTLATQLGVDPQQAQALAGAALGTVKETVADKVGEDAAASLDKAVPELGGWQQQAVGLLGGGGLGSLLGASGGGALGGLLGGATQSGGLLESALGAVQGAGQAASMAGLISKLGLDADKAAMIAPIVLQFIKSRLDPAMVDKIMAVVPMLSGGESAGGLMGGLGKLFG